MTRPLRLGFLTHAAAAHAADPARSCAELVELFVAAERLGYDGGWIAQHHVGLGAGAMPSPLVALAAIARRTRRIDLGTAVVTLPLEDPIRLAEDAALLDMLSEGRLQLGLGSGGANRAAFGAFGVPADTASAAFHDKRALLRSLLEGGALPHAPALRLEPPAPGLARRLWRAPGTADGAKAAGEGGDFLLLGTAVHDPATVQRPLAEAYLRAWDHARGKPRIGVVRAVFPAASKEAAWAELAPDLAPFAEWLRRDGIVAHIPDTEEIVRRLNVHHGTPPEILRSLEEDPALLPYADELIVVVQSESTVLADAIRRLDIIASEIAPGLGWRPAAASPRP